MTSLQSQCYSWWWVGGGERGVSPEDHLHCFECVQLQVKTAPDSQLLNLLSVSRLVTILNKADQCGVICKLQELVGGSSDVQLFVYREKSSGERTQPWGAPVLIVRVLESCQFILKGIRDDGVKSGAEVYKQDPHISPCSVGKLRGVQWRPSDKPKPVFQMISWPPTLEPQVCSH